MFPIGTLQLGLIVAIVIGCVDPGTRFLQWPVQRHLRTSTVGLARGSFGRNLDRRGRDRDLLHAVGGLAYETSKGTSRPRRRDK